MKREDIEKASVEARMASAETLTTYGMQTSLDDIWGLAQNISLDDLAESAFIKGAAWRINSVWHNPKNKYPDVNTIVLVEKEDGSIYQYKVFAKSQMLGWKRWAYIKDLIPNTEN